MAAWTKTLPQDFGARWDAVVADLSARSRASAEKKPSAAAQKKVIDALERLEKMHTVSANAGPAWSLTTREQLGEWLLANGRAKEALAAFEREVATRPNRARSLLGAARAAKAAGDAAKATDHYRALADLWRDADADLPALAEVRAGAAGGA
jgi:tetratricopeptide (TPR) repeat protein